MSFEVTAVCVSGLNCPTCFTSHSKAPHITGYNVSLSKHSDAGPISAMDSALNSAGNMMKMNNRSIYQNNPLQYRLL